MADEEPRCPTCGSSAVPKSIVAAFEHVDTLNDTNRAVLWHSLKSMYLYTGRPGTEEQVWAKSMRTIIGRVSAVVVNAIDDVGVDAVWAFYCARYPGSGD